MSVGINNVTHFETRFNDYVNPIFLWSSFSEFARDANMTILKEGDPNNPKACRHLNNYSVPPRPGLFALWSNKIEVLPNWLSTRIIYEPDERDQEPYYWAEIEDSKAVKSSIFDLEFNCPLILTLEDSGWVGSIEGRIEDLFIWNTLLLDYRLREFLQTIRLR